MSNKIQPVRGCKDLYGNEIKIFNHIITTARQAAESYGFGELAMPIFEFSEIYERNLGETSDIISKEVYKFPDRGGNFLTLRPEFTAGVVRAFISNGDLAQILPQKFFSYGPLFRYDRPQKGRQRQFHQINFEILGAAHFISDVEIILLASGILRQLEILPKTILQINSLGNRQERIIYEEALKKYFINYQDLLSPNSKLRLEKNPLRILDSKDESDIELVKNAPLISDFYSPKSQENFANILNLLDQFGISYQINPRLVRGLDYYNDLVFEFIANDGDLGAQNTVLSGGRYDGLVAKMGGNPTPAIGFAAGIERMILMMNYQAKIIRPVFIVFISENERNFALQIAKSLREAGIYVEISYDDNFKKQMKRANQLNAKFAIIIGEDEIKNGIANIKNFDNGEQNKVAFDEMVNFLSATGVI